jgi:hypothetical protein
MSLFRKLKSLGFLLLLCFVLLIPSAGFAQANFTAQLRGSVQDSSGAVVPSATVIITNEATGVATTVTSDGAGRYIFMDLQPASYTINVEATGFSKLIQSGIVLRVSQQSVLDFTLQVGTATQSVEVKSDAILLNSANAELGQEIAGRYVTEIPLNNRQIEKLAFLAPGVTESQGFQADQTNENFASNGQRNSSAEMRLDGSILSVPEAGEGAMFWSHYQPSVEIVDEFKVQTNGFSAEYGSNGGTVVNIISKSGTNELHGSGYYFGQWTALNANNFFANQQGQAVPQYHRHQFGGTVGGPIVKNKLFYFFNYDRTIYSSPFTLLTTVPTPAQRQGDFSQTFNQDGTLQQIFNPNTAFPSTSSSGPDVQRMPFPGNKIPAPQFDPIGAKIVALYPNPTGPGDPVTGLNNFSKNYLLGQPAHQYNFKMDNAINEKNQLSGRFSKGFLERQSPSDFIGAIGQGDELNDYYNIVLQHTWTASPTLVLTNRVGVDRHHQTRFPENNVSPATVGFPSLIESANGSVAFPNISVQNYQPLGLTGYTQTIEAQTQWVFDSTAAKVIGPHNVQFGGEARILLSNFFQPPSPSGAFQFGQNPTMQFSLTPNQDQGNGIASLLLGWAGTGPGNTSAGDLSIHPSVAEKSRETALFVQDDWKFSPRLTLNLGLRWEISTPYDDRFNRLQIANFTADTGVNVPGIGEIRGIDQFVTSSHRHASAAWHNFGPRIGVAYQFTQKTVLRAGGGLYYGVNYATSYQDLGPAFRTDLPYEPTLDNGLTRFATLENPFPFGNVGAQGRTYGKLAGWGFPSNSNQSETFRNANIYQWSFSLQHELPGNQVVEIAYSANRSTHLPDAYVRDRNYIRTAVREQYGSSGLYALVANPFYPLFVGPHAIFNEPDSVYAQPMVQHIDLLRPYPQFPGVYEGFAEFVANSWYNSMQVKYEKRYSYGLNVIASYTLAKQVDNGSASSNGWLGNATSIQDFNNLRGEYSVGATDARHRMILTGSYELPFGRGKKFGSNINKVLDGIAGGWQMNAYFTYQSGLPLNVVMTSGRLADGFQRPNVTGNPRSQYSIQQVVASHGSENYFNIGAFSDPGDQVPGNEPRFNTALRGDGIRDLDFSLFKNFQYRERYRLQLRAEFFNFTNTPRFLDPGTSFPSSNFGVITGQGNSPRQAQMGARLTF